jgi:membrane protein
MKLRFEPGAVWKLFKEAFAEWNRDKALRLGASLSFYSVLSLPSLLVIMVTVAALIFGREAAQQRIVEQFGTLVGPEGTRAVEGMLTGDARPQKGALSAIFAGLLLLFGATGVFAELQDSLNIIWDVKAKPRGGLWGLIRTRILSLNIVLAVGFLLIVSLVISAALAALGEIWGSRLANFETVLKILDVVVSLGVLTVLFAILFRRLPDIRIPWRDVWLGAGVTSLLFTIGKVAIGLYLGRSAVGTSYGAAGPLVILLLWIYYSSLIFFFGAEFTQVYSRAYGSRIGKPAEALGEHPAREAARAKVVSGDGPAKPAARTAAAAPMPVPRADLARERLRVALSDGPPKGRSSRDWGPIVFGGGLIVSAMLVAVRLLRR